jgi:hypothetical protein
MDWTEDKGVCLSFIKLFYWWWCNAWIVFTQSVQRFY